MPFSRISAFARALFWPLLAFALVMAALPKPPKLPTGLWGDKWEHALTFVVLTALAQAGYRAAGRWRLALGLSGIGALIEVYQLIPVLNRDSDIRDWVVDSLAVLLVTGLAVLIDRVRARDQ